MGRLCRGSQATRKNLLLIYRPWQAPRGVKPSCRDSDMRGAQAEDQAWFLALGVR